ncbi:MAG: Ubiquinone/menaquinone biosynthesis C-methylase UbiE/MenG [Methanophagales archaeon]|nr:class I SAM-dependent methyltransferase [Methanophagales archaeon]MCU4139928.1 Ubiquinone/menaquinone biosynthesis C-methylase UbiE/MenG [Methanophagales archaeon]
MEEGRKVEKSGKKGGCVAVVVELLPNEEALVRELCRRLKQREARRILDVGCGTGKLALFIAEMLREQKEGCVVVGIDTDTTKVKKARERALSMREGCVVRFEVQSATQTRFKDGSFDAVVSLKALHEISDADAALREAFRVLRSGGSIFIIDWVRCPATESHAHFPLYFTEESMRDALLNAGFEDVSIEKSESGELMLASGLKPRGKQPIPSSSA